MVQNCIVIDIIIQYKSRASKILSEKHSFRTRGAWPSCNSLADRWPARPRWGWACDNLFSNFWPRLQSAHCSRVRACRHSQRPPPSATRNARPVRPPSDRRSGPRRTSSPLLKSSATGKCGKSRLNHGYLYRGAYGWRETDQRPARAPS